MSKAVQTVFPHIKGLKDIKDCQFTENSNSNSSSSDVKVVKYMCPITRTEMNGLHPFVIIWTTGKVLSMKAIREIPSEELQTEFGPFADDDIVRLFPTDDELVAVKEKMERRRQNRKKDKKEGQVSKKRHIDDIQPTDNGDVVNSTETKKKISKAEQIATAAAKAVDDQAANSQVFKKLFHTGQEADKHDRDLFMSVAGIRYTLR